MSRVAGCREYESLTFLALQNYDEILEAADASCFYRGI